jgi:hypothetical protein
MRVRVFPNSPRPMQPPRVRKLKRQDCGGRYRTIAVFEDLGHRIATCIDGGDEMNLDFSCDTFLRHKFRGKLPLNTELKASPRRSQPMTRRSQSDLRKAVIRSNQGQPCRVRLTSGVSVAPSRFPRKGSASMPHLQ